MESLFTFTSSPSQCGYLPDRKSQLDYEIVGRMTPVEFQERIDAGWRRFGHALFRPNCKVCTLCRSIRIPVATFRPNRSQKRVCQLNDGHVQITVGRPMASAENIALYDRFHAYQHETKGWPE